MLKKLPVGIQTFEEIINDGYLYIDKTQGLHELITTGKYYFLSRPRRFGKSLTLSTLKAIFTGQKALFAGLWIEKRRDWGKTNPVIHLQTSKLDYQTLGLDAALQRALHQIAGQYGMNITAPSLKTLFAELLEKLAQQQGKVVLLIDEYDKPLIDYVDNIEQAKANQQTLKNFYSVIKDSDPYLQFLLITGVSKFSKVSVFSDLNNLYDISRDHRFAGLVGYTQDELEHYFSPYLPAVGQRLKMDRASLLVQLKDWYNGYSWDAETFVYNPFSILSFFQAQSFENFWFETGTPTFLIRLLREQQLFNLDNQQASSLVFSSYDIERLQILPILFQTGYLTIKAKDEFDLYQLSYPNREVRNSMLMYLIGDIRHDDPTATTPLVVHLHKAFQSNDLEQVVSIIKTIFKKIPSHIFIKEAESYYHSLIYLVFFYLGQYTQAEVNDSTGRIDCVVQTRTHIYIIEFKLDKSAEIALQQVRDKDYAGAYRTDPRQKVLVGINFSSKHKTVDGWLLENG